MIRQRKRATYRGPKKRGAKTFSSEEAAKKYANEKGIASFALKNLRLNSKQKPKLRIVEQ